MIAPLFLLQLFGVVGAVTVHHLRTASSKNASSAAPAAAQLPTFPKYVEGVATGRGIWKWNNALVAYERHFRRFKTKPVKVAEVGVWSGGSLLMWQAVLGAKCHVYGLDIAQNALKFQDNRTTITIVDQADPVQWVYFFKTVTPTLDILVDDGLHASYTMLTTTTSVWPKLSFGGVLAIEDINGANHFEGFLSPAAQFYGATSFLASIHMYPLVLIAEKASPAVPAVDPSAAPGAVVTRVSTWAELTTALAHPAPASSLVVLENAEWGSTFLTAYALTSTFKYFMGLYTPKKVFSTPPGCAATNNAKCDYALVNSEQQDKITGVHILPSKLVVEIAASKPVIQAVRHGDQWVKYPTR